MVGKEGIVGMEPPAHFPSSSLGQAEGRAVPVSRPGHHYISPTCVGERRS